MLSKNELDVLASLFPEKNFKTIREIQKNGNYSYERTYSALWSLRDKRIVDLKRYGNVIVATPNYNSDFSLLGFVYHAVNKKTNFYEEQKSFFGAENPTKTKKAVVVIDSEEIINCIKKIENLDAELISIIEISTKPKNKITFFYIGDKKLANEVLKIEYIYNIRVDPIIETIESLSKRKEDPKYLNSVILKGFEKFYTIFYL